MRIITAEEVVPAEVARKVLPSRKYKITKDFPCVKALSDVTVLLQWLGTSEL